MRITVATIATAFCLLSAVGDAAEIKVISTHNIEPTLLDLQVPFERATGHKISIEAQGAAATRRRIEAGDAGDVVVNSRPVLDGLVQAGRIKAGSVVDIAHSSIGVVVRTGQRKPDISTDAALRTALLQAPSIAYPDPALGSLAGNYLAGLIERWGLADELKPKTKLAAGGAPAARMVAAGEADIGLNQIAEFMTVPGIEFVTPLPPALTDKVVMAAGILDNAPRPDAAAQWMHFLASPAAAPALAAHGMSP
jgi:molybdate transport system substrate-binding protein